MKLGQLKFLSLLFTDAAITTITSFQHMPYIHSPRRIISKTTLSLYNIESEAPQQQNVVLQENILNNLNVQQEPLILQSTQPRTTMENSIKDWISSSSLNVAAAASQPSPEEVKLLQGALSAFYNEKDVVKAESLLSKTIDAWQRQPADEQAALYRIRGDCYMELDVIESAIQDYGESISLLQSPGGKQADPNELPSSHLGRARAIRSLSSTKLTPKLTQTAISDYEKYLILSSRDGEYMDNDEERIEDGITRNPYAAWEYAATLRTSGDYKKAAIMRLETSNAFDLIGDTAHSVISYLDFGIDLAMSYSTKPESTSLEEVQTVLTKGISSTSKVEGRDITLLQNVISKEGEARLALASILWNEKGKPASDAEQVFGDACIRLEQLEQDNEKQMKKQKQEVPNRKVLKFSIDGSSSVLGAGEISCSRFKNEKFVSEVLGWPEELKVKVVKLQKLQR